MTSVLASWRTSLAGAAVLLAVAACLYTHALEPAEGGPLVLVALGLLAARDGSVTSEQSGAAPASATKAGQ